MIENWLKQIDNNSRIAEQLFGKLSTDQLNWKPDATTWSVGQNLEHLILINRSYFPTTEAIRKGEYQMPWTGRIGFLVRLFGRIILQSVQPDRRRKMKTFPLWEPHKSDLPGDLIRRFLDEQQELKNWITSSKDLVENNVIISSPANKMVTYTLTTAIDIIIVHEQRHFKQAEELLSKMPAA